MSVGQIYGGDFAFYDLLRIYELYYNGGVYINLQYIVVIVILNLINSSNLWNGYLSYEISTLEQKLKMSNKGKIKIKKRLIWVRFLPRYVLAK